MLTLLVLLTVQTPQRLCPVSAAPVGDDSPSLCVSGVEFRFKDESARKSFAADPRASLSKVVKGNPSGVYGVSFFDPVARKSLILSRDGHVRAADMSSVPEWHVAGGVAFPLSKRSARALVSNPESYLAEPESYSLWCPIMSKEMPTIERTLGYVDLEGVRYFLCCDTCVSSAQRQRSGPGWGEAVSRKKSWVRLFGKAG